MKELIQKIIIEYSHFLREKALFEQHLEMRENSDMREALAVLKIKLGTVESWFALLDAEERFAFRQALQGNQEKSAAMQSAAMMWMWRISKEGRTPWQAREQAVIRIAAFADANEEILHAIFDDV